ncbi:MAG: hypothetical protein ACE5JA_03080 [bacterium]
MTSQEMSFIAGILSSLDRLPDHLRAGFRKCIQAMPLPPEMETHSLEGTSSILFQAGYPGLWHGPKLLRSKEGWLVAATGAENPFPGASHTQQTSDRLWDWIASRALSDRLPDDLLHFSAACVSPTGDRVLLVNDPLGTATLSYYVGDRYIVFSSRPSFLGRFCNGLTVNYEAIFEFLLIGHLLGNKTFFREVSVLPPGGLLDYADGAARVRRHTWFESVATDTQMSIEEAVDRVFQLLSSMFSPAPSCDTRVNCFLSGGWDSRLLAAVLSNANLVDRTWSTETIGQFSAERSIAALAAQFLGLESEVVPPGFFSVIKDFYEHSRLVDFSSDTGPWIMSLLDALPVGQIYVDGFLVDVLLRPDRHVPSALVECVNTGDVERAATYFFEMYLEAGGPFSYVRAGGKPWQKLLKRGFYEEQTKQLKENIENELADVECGQDFATSFVIKNRQRRGIAPLPILLMGSKGPMLLPFCNLKLARLCLRIPLEHKTSGQLQFGLLERARKGLGRLISTNSDKTLLQPYIRRWTPIDFVRRLLFGGWQYEQAVTQLGSDVFNLLGGGENVARLRLLKYPYQLQRLLLVQQAIALLDSKG